MSSENFHKPYKQRFKGVETFLRRVAFNLGNTASQTEVKIISCIPIDVTDLQQKIINLEKQLYETQQQMAVTEEIVPEKPKDKPSTVVNTALYGSSFAKHSSTVSYCSNKPIDNIKSAQIATYFGDCSSRTKKSNVSFVFPALSAVNTEQSYDCNTHKDFSKNNTAVNNRYKSIFRKRKKNYKGNNKVKTHLVYYAHQTNDNPFKISESPLKYPLNNNNNDLCLSHLSNVIRRQYDPMEVIKEYSDTSHFSKPVCRDGNDKNRSYDHYESDICSCCHDKFQNIDNYMTKIIDYDSILTTLHNSFEDTKVYYDSKHYDLIPVKESSSKIIKNNFEQRKENKMNVEMKCWPQRLRTKPKHYPVIVNYQTQTPTKRYPNKKLQAVLSDKKKPQILNTNQGKIKKMDRQTGIETSKSCCIDCSNIYTKDNPQHAKLRKYEQVQTILQKNESVATDEANIKSQVNNQSTQLELSTEDCRDLTLGQIKTILQSVLEEVKTKTKLNNADEVVKRDAVVQKGSSQNSMPGDSTLLHSYTYNNSYNANTYLPSCSNQIPHGQYFLGRVPYQPMKCLNNYPVFVQPASGRHLCGCYYRRASYKPHNTQAVAAATNTDKRVDISSSKETEKLIKEIYKSMALNLEYSTKNSSTSEYKDMKSSGNVSTNKTDVKNKEVSNEKDVKVITMGAPIQSNINENKSENASVNTLPDRKMATITYFNKAESAGNINKDKSVHGLQLQNFRSSDTIAEDEEETDEFSEETDSDETLIVEEELKQNKAEKKGFFNRILKSVNLFKNKKRIQKEMDEASESDDYETIYSEKSARVSPRTYKEARSYGKVDTLDRDRVRKSPYLEQEYRRRWNENLTFREQESKHSSERGVSRHSTPPCQSTPVYWTNYEARSAIVDQKLPKQNTIYHAPECVPQEISQEHKLQQKSVKKRLDWFKKHKFGVKCGEQWKKFILEN